jgi:uncharacterized 2Fe-2S/4Fe-4S cluster protein (DUF4445 family)
MPIVTFIPDDVSVEVRDGENLLRAAMAADVRISAPCGGSGTCGKCRVVVESGSVEAQGSSKLSEEEIAAGHVLACVSTVVGDVSVRIPPESRPGDAPTQRDSQRTPNVTLTAEEHAARLPDTSEDEPPVAQRVLHLKEPDLSDNSSDLSRVRQGLRRTFQLDEADIPLEAVRTLPSALRTGDWDVVALIAEEDTCRPRVAGFRAGADTGGHAVAVDVGTTTIEVALVDMVSGEVVAHDAEYNSQVALGEDVITRVIAGSNAEGLEDLRTRVVATICEIVAALCETADVDSQTITHYVAAGNTVMTHLLLGVSPAAIRETPYTPVASSFPWTSAVDAGLPGNSATQLIALPCPASWLGGDIVSGVLSTGIPWSDALTLFIDIGTNGEIVLGNKDWLVACSCSAGPAFEGAGISHGMRAAAGAIEQVRIDTETLEPMILTIGGAPALGICGSGLIDCVSELFLSGAIDRDGKFTREDSERIRHTKTGREFVLVRSEESGTDSDIVITEPDIENLMRAKAAIHSGINVLVESVDIDVDQIDEIVIAGGFGHYLDLERVMSLGMVPELPANRFRFIGNASLLGAELVARSAAMLEQARSVASMLTYLELSVNAGFMDMYVSSLFLPHTNLSLFPETERLLSERTAERAVG